MPGETENASNASLHVAYEQVCRSYTRIDDFRAKLLGLIPAFSAIGFALLAGRDNGGVPAAQDEPRSLFLAAGLFGLLVSSGLLFYELRGVQRCIRLTEVAKQLEGRMSVDGEFSRWPQSIGRLINEPIAGGIVYGAVIGGWFYVAIVMFSAVAAAVSAALMFGLCLGLVWTFYLHVRPH